MERDGRPSRRGARSAGLFGGMSRHAMFAGLCILGLANGSANRIGQSFADNGAALAVGTTFDISVIVWLAFAAVPVMLLRLPDEPPTRQDVAVAGAALVPMLLPVAPASWLALTGLAAFFLRRTLTRPAGLLLLATCCAMFWGRWLLLLGGTPLLSGDAMMVAWLIGGDRVGNTVGAANADGFVWIAPGCSSLTNVSLAILAWALVSQFLGAGRSLQRLLRCLLACAAVIFVNVCRIGAMVTWPDRFDLLHGPAGAALASWISLLAIAGISLAGVRRDPAAPA